ncbi:MAG: tetratricopeptide repeat protein [Anaerolineae bacterium]|nr:tetratricopeptide repeat protein [Anaerolineae bacterium]
MAVGTVTLDAPDLFRTYVLTNIQYWRDFMSSPETSPAELDQYRQQIITAIHFAIELDEAWPYTVELISAFSEPMERSGHWSVWQDVLTRARQVAHQAKDTLTEVEFSTLLARLYTRQDHTREAISQYYRTINLARGTEDYYNKARAYSNLGYLYIDYNRWWRAEVLCCAALRIFEQYGNDHGQAHTHNHLGTLYTRQYNWDLAQEHLKQACTFWQTMTDDHGLMRGYLNLSLLYAEAERPEEALRYSEKALKQAELTSEKSELGLIYLNMSYAHRLNGDPGQAEKYARQSEALYRRFINARYLASAWVNLGEALLDQHHTDKAKPYLETALINFQTLNYAYGEIRALLALIKYGQLAGQLEQTAVWITAANTRIAQLHWPAQRHHFQMLLERCLNSWRY